MRFFTKQINPRYFGSCRSWCVKGTEVLNCSLKKLYCGLLPAQNADIRRRKLARLITQYRDKGSSRAAIAWREKNQENDMTEDLTKKWIAVFKAWEFTQVYFLYTHVKFFFFLVWSKLVTVICSKTYFQIEFSFLNQRDRPRGSCESAPAEKVPLGMR